MCSSIVKKTDDQNGDSQTKAEKTVMLNYAGTQATYLWGLLGYG